MPDTTTTFASNTSAKPDAKTDANANTRADTNTDTGPVTLFSCPYRISKKALDAILKQEANSVSTLPRELCKSTRGTHLVKVDRYPACLYSDRPYSGIPSDKDVIFIFAVKSPSKELGFPQDKDRWYLDIDDRDQYLPCELKDHRRYQYLRPNVEKYWPAAESPALEPSTSSGTE